MEETVPPLLAFYRVPIMAPEPDPAPPEPAGKMLNAIGGDASVSPPATPKHQLTRIYGSVSTADMVESIKAVLAEHQDGPRVVIGPEDISIVAEEHGEDRETGIEADRLKALGDYQIEIRLKGSSVVKRVVSVRAQETGQ